MRCKVGDPISKALSENYKPSKLSCGPFCYLCGRPILKPADKRWVAVGPDQERKVFIEAGDGRTDSVVIGASCLKRVPLESILPKAS